MLCWTSLRHPRRSKIRIWQRRHVTACSLSMQSAYSTARWAEEVTHHNVEGVAVVQEIVNMRWLKCVLPD